MKFQNIFERANSFTWSNLWFHVGELSRLRWETLRTRPHLTEEQVGLIRRLIYLSAGKTKFDDDQPYTGRRSCTKLDLHQVGWEFDMETIPLKMIQCSLKSWHQKWDCFIIFIKLISPFQIRALGILQFCLISAFCIDFARWCSDIVNVVMPMLRMNPLDLTLLPIFLFFFLSFMNWLCLLPLFLFVLDVICLETNFCSVSQLIVFIFLLGARPWQTGRRFGDSYLRRAQVGRENRKAQKMRKGGKGEQNNWRRD